MVDGVDENANPSFRMLALTTRLGLNVGGYRVGDLQVNGTVEADFYCMSGSMAALRLRHAYVGLLWDNLELGDLQVNVGQTWHPMAADLPHITNLETGAPFNPFNRSPQVMFHWTVGKFTWTGGILYPMQYLPVGPVYTTGPTLNVYTDKYEPGTTVATGKSADFNKYGMIPEVYLGASFKSGGFLGKAGVNFFSCMPRWQAPAVTVVDEAARELTIDYDHKTLLKNRLYAISPFVYLQFTKGSFQIKAKSILAQAGVYAATGYHQVGLRLRVQRPAEHYLAQHFGGQPDPARFPRYAHIGLQPGQADFLPGVQLHRCLVRRGLPQPWRFMHGRPLGAEPPRRTDGQIQFLTKKTDSFESRFF